MIPYVVIASTQVSNSLSSSSFGPVKQIEAGLLNVGYVEAGPANGEREYDDLERRLAQDPLIKVPTITLEGEANGAPHPDAALYAKKFSGKYEHRIISGGIGHNLPQEAPRAFAKAVIDVDGFDAPQVVIKAR